LGPDPPQAINRTEVFTSNPIFGLNALGGAISIEMKNASRGKASKRKCLGSYGRVSGLFEYGKQVDNYSFYVTADAAHDDGWRYFSPSSSSGFMGTSAIARRTQSCISSPRRKIKPRRRWTNADRSPLH